jgi:hypothetical protein
MRAAALIAALALGALSLSACSDRECLHGHYQPVTTYITTSNGTLVPNVNMLWICDQYAPEGEQ